MGFKSGSEYRIDTHTLEVGDVIIWYTDGLIENLNASGEQFGKSRLRRLLTTFEGMSAQEILDRIIETALEHFGDEPWGDDVTLIVGRVTK